MVRIWTEIMMGSVANKSAHTHVELAIECVSKEHLNSEELRNLAPFTPLVLKLQRGRQEAEQAEWSDGTGKRIEKQIADVVASLVVAGEAQFRHSLVEAARFEEQQKRWKEEERARKKEKIEHERLSELRKSGELLRQAGEIRELIAQVATAAEQGQVHVSPQEMAEWKDWAHSYADRLDPVQSGQVLRQIRAMRSRTEE